MGAWGCPHEHNEQCYRVPGQACDPGMKGCILYGRVTFSVAEKNPPSRRSDPEADRKSPARRKRS